MPDISMCRNPECPKRDTCYRHTATPSIFQLYASFDYRKDDCYCERKPKEVKNET